MAKISGTKEWASSNVNILRGCEHNCRYCYAAEMNRRFRNKNDWMMWSNPILLLDKVTKGYGKRKGTVMFPTTHDITWKFLEPCLIVLEKLLEAGNKVLIVSKPDPDCIDAITRSLREFREQILFRFTIGAKNDKILKFWEPGAPSYAKRKNALVGAYSNGFHTSISIEPMLDPPKIVELVEDLTPYVSDSIWIGKMNQIRRRIKPGGEAELVEQQIKSIEVMQSNHNIKKIYSELRKHPLIKWKESIKEVIGLELAQEKGLDI